MRSLLRLGRAVRAVSSPVNAGERNRRYPERTYAHRSLLAMLVVVACVLSAEAALAQPAAAEAVPGPLSMFGPPGLPDGRVYEEVSPPNKHGSEAGSAAGDSFIVASSDGNAAAFETSGPVGKTQTGYTEFAIARRSHAGWSSRSAIPRGQGTQALFSTNPHEGLGFSAELTETLFGAADAFVPNEVPSNVGKVFLFDEGENVEWLGKPTIAEPFQFKNAGSDAPAGGSLDYSIVYFSFSGALTAADQEPNPTLGGISHAEGQGNGFYEWDKGTLTSAGTLPDGHLDPDGAAPAATVDSPVYDPEELNNQVSEDGRRAFFVSPDPATFSKRPTELYVHKTAPDGIQSTVLVSRDLLLPETGGLPAAAPDGVVEGNGNGDNGSFIYASPDGSHVFFESVDSLTADAPNEETVKEYQFDTETDVLTYLAGVADLSYTPCEASCGLPTVQVLRSSQDGSNFMFVRQGELELWSEGTVTDVAPFQPGLTNMVIRATSTGSSYVFDGRSPFAKFGFNNAEGTLNEIYRYVTATNTLSCLSCPPAGAEPLAGAGLSGDLNITAGEVFKLITGNHAMSNDGDRIFFNTPMSLVPQDSNGLNDVYEWENGTVYLVSTGVSGASVVLGDNSASGNDVFFATTEGLAPGDNDEAYDVYDARVPRPGDQLPPSEVPCEGPVCQGPPSVPQLFSPPSSETFDGAGDLKPATPAVHGAPKSLTRKQKLARALKACKQRKKQSARAKCKQRANRLYGAKAANSGSHSKRGVASSHHNGRGK